MPALDHVLEPVLHVVAQIIEAVFVVGAVGDIARIGFLALGVVEAVDDDAGGHAEEAVDLTHPFGVASGEIIVNGDDVDALAGQRVEVDRQGCHQRLAFTGLHLGDIALVEHHAANQLHVEMPLSERALGRLADGGEGRNQNIVERLALGESFSEFGGTRLQRLVRKCRQLALQGVDGIDPGLIPLDPPVIGGTEKLAGERADHAKFLYLRSAKPPRRGPPGCLSTHRDASQADPKPGIIRQMSGNSAIQGSTAKNAAKYALSPLT
ncbi:hypothetical protein GALL_488700 [mine drainage metagenome]|uniref:Uncharacterized protein n=1 Tax=mine drainage metagenome TaxID=410659 RepID=A0A1J5PP29_9ZZZZ